jgi:hypothetical protein
MTIATLDDAILGVKPTQYYFKAVSGTLVAARPFSPFYTAGIPGPAVAPTPGLAGAALTSYAGQIPFPAAVGGDTIHLAGFWASTGAQTGTFLLCDRLWHNSGINITLNTAQTINSVTLPARDNTGTTDGAGVYAGVEISTATGVGTPTINLSYTNQAGTAGRASSNSVLTVASSAIGTFYPIGLQAGDTGIRSIQTYTQTATWTSGTLHLVMYRILARVECPIAAAGEQLTLLTSGLPRLYDNTVPFIIFIPNTTTTTTIAAGATFTQN